MNAGIFLYPLLIAADVLLFLNASGRMRYALIVFIAMHILCWVLAGTGALRTLGFYVSLGLAWLVLGGYAMDAPFFLRSAAAIAILAIAAISWGNGSPGVGFRPPKVSAKPGVWRLFRFAVPAMLFSIAALLLMADPIPRSSKIIMEAGSGLRDMAAPWVQGMTNSEDEDYKDNENREPVTDSESRDFGVRRSLPDTANLRMGNDLHVFLRFPDAADFLAASKMRPYVRQLVLNGYADGEWFHIPGMERLIADEDDGEVDGRVEISPASEKDIAYEVFVKGSSGQALPFIPGLVEAEFPNIIAVLDGWYQAGNPGDVHYSAVSRQLRLEDITAPILRSGVATREYLEIPDRDLLRRLRGLLAEAGSADLPLREKLLAVRDYMRRNYVYSTKIDNIAALPPVENFLFHEKRGYCDFFATSGALLCRAMGLPARTAYGFATGEAHPDEQILSFRENHAHSWTEIFLDEFGWVIFDITPPGSEATAEEIKDANGPAPDPANFADARTETDDPNSGKHPLIAWFESIHPRFVYIAIAVCAGLLILVRVLGRMQGGDEKERKRRRSQREKSQIPGVEYDPYPAYFLDFRKLCRLLGCNEDAGDTLRELMRKIHTQGIPLDPEFDSMSRYHYGVRYEGHITDPSLEKSFRKMIRAFWKHYQQ